MKETMKGINIKSLFSMNLKRLRAIANISQMNLADRSGLTHNFINDLENGKKWASAETIAKLAIALKAEPSQFFISETKWNNPGAEIFALYLDDFSDSFGKMVNEYRSRYVIETSREDTPGQVQAGGGNTAKGNGTPENSGFHLPDRKGG